MGWLKNRMAVDKGPEPARRPDADLDTLISWAQTRFTDNEALERLRPNAGEPLPEPDERQEWIGRQLAAAFAVPATRRIYALEGALAKLIDARLREPARLSNLIDSTDNVHHRNETEALAIASRHAALAAGGMAAVRRIAAEAERLAELPDAAVLRRLECSPAVRLDGIPEDPPRRRQWLCDALTGEAAAIAGGAMSPMRVAQAALLSLAPVRHERPADGSPIRAAIGAWSQHTDPTRQFPGRAARMAGQSDEALIARFHAIPGGDRPPRDPDERKTWVCRALEAEVIRPLAGLAGAKLRPLSVELHGIATGDPQTGFHFGGTLVVDGERICRIVSPGEGVIEADQWSRGCGPDDIGILDLYLAATGPARDGGETPDSLAATLIDIVAMHVALDAYRTASADATLFYVEEADGPAILSVRIPEGGSREGARDAMKSARPEATPLDLMTEEEAAMTWITVAP